MIKILFVCHGNICRSPMAEFIFKDTAEKHGLSAHFYIASAATSTDEIWNGIGNPVYPPAKKELAKHGISCEGKRAVQLKKSDYEQYDYLIGMEGINIRHMQKLTGGDPEGKFYKMMEFAGENWKSLMSGRRDMDRAGDVADPWYTGDFGATWRDVSDGCEGLLEYLLAAERDRVYENDRV